MVGKASATHELSTVLCDRKFDKIGEDELDSDEDQMKHPPISGTGPAISHEKAQPPPQQMTKKGKENRLRFEYQGQLIYEWEQSLEEVVSHSCHCNSSRRPIFTLHHHLEFKRKILIFASLLITSSLD